LFQQPVRDEREAEKAAGKPLVIEEVRRAGSVHRETKAES